MGIVQILSDQTGCGKSNMAASKLGTPISQLPGEIETKLQRLYPCFRGQATRRDKWEYIVQNHLFGAYSSICYISSPKLLLWHVASPAALSERDLYSCFFSFYSRYVLPVCVETPRVVTPPFTNRYDFVVVVVVLANIVCICLFVFVYGV